VHGFFCNGIAMMTFTGFYT